MEDETLNFPPVNKALGRTPLIRTRLVASDYLRFENACRLEGKTMAEVAREGLCYYLDAREALVNNANEKGLAKLIRSQTERLAGLLVRIATDLGMIIYLMYRHMVDSERDEVMRKAKDWSVKRLRYKLAGEEAELKQSVNEQRKTEESN